jgi:protein SCO1
MQRAAMWLTLTGSLLALLLLANYHRQSSQLSDLHDSGFVAINNPVPIEPFQLTDHEDRKVGREVLQDNWSLVFFGFTYCPDVCPTTLGILNQVVSEMAQPPRIILVSADPERDTPELLKGYVTAFNPSFIGLTGELEQLTSLGYQLRVAFRKTDETENYMIEHSANIALVNPAGEFVGYFTIPHRKEEMVQVLQRVM